MTPTVNFFHFFLWVHIHHESPFHWVRSIAILIQNLSTHLSCLLFSVLHTPPQLAIWNYQFMFSILKLFCNSFKEYRTVIQDHQFGKIPNSFTRSSLIHFPLQIPCKSCLQNPHAIWEYQTNCIFLMGSKSIATFLFDIISLILGPLYRILHVLLFSCISQMQLEITCSPNQADNTGYLIWFFSSFFIPDFMKTEARLS